MLAERSVWESMRDSVEFLGQKARIEFMYKGGQVPQEDYDKFVQTEEQIFIFIDSLIQSQ